MECTSTRVYVMLNRLYSSHWPVWRCFRLVFTSSPKESNVHTETCAATQMTVPSLMSPKLESWLTCLETGNKLGIIDLDSRVFGRQPRLDIIQRVVVWQLAKRRAGTARVKVRSEVRGGGKKPWPQKGFGKARQGSIRAPQWRGGGVVHGPRGPVSYDYTLPKKVRSLGLCAALSVKYSQGDLFVVDSLSLQSHKTKHLLSILNKHQWESVLFVNGGETVDLNMSLASHNIEQVDVLPSVGINVYSIILRNTLVLTIGAVRLLEERLSG